MHQLPQKDEQPGKDGDFMIEEGEPEPSLRFVAARPESNKARREARAIIRTHASRMSWAKVKMKRRQGTSSQIGSSMPARGRPDQSNVAIDLENTDLVSDSNDQQYSGGNSSQAGPLSSWPTVGPGALTRTLESYRIASPIDPFCYPSRLPKEIAGPIIGQGDPANPRMFGYRRLTLPTPHL